MSNNKRQKDNITYLRLAMEAAASEANAEDSSGDCIGQPFGPVQPMTPIGAITGRGADFKARLARLSEKIANEKARPREAEYDGARPGQVQVTDIPRPATRKCPKCGHNVNDTYDHGWFKDPVTLKPVPCPACSPVVIRARRRRASDGHLKKLVASGRFQNMQNFPANAATLSLASYPAKGDQGAKKAMLAFVNGRPDEIIMIGEAGVGKSGLAIAAGRALADQGVQVLFLPMALYIAMLQENFDKGKDEESNHIREIARMVEVLIIDDLGTERVTDSGFTVEQTEGLIEDRHNLGLRTIITTNMSLEGLAAYWHMPKYDRTKFQPSARLISRIEGWYKQIVFSASAPDLRQRRGA